MKPLLALLTAMLLCVGACACGGSSGGGGGGGSRGARSAAPAGNVSNEIKLESTKTDSDKDNDIGVIGADDKRNTQALDFGHAATASERRAITALIVRYYAAALAENGTKACAMIYSTLAEAIPADYSGNPGVSYMQGATTCAESMTLLLKHFHQILAIEVPKLKVVSVRLEEHHGLAVLNFGPLPERQIYITREGHIWKMTSLLDLELQ